VAKESCLITGGAGFIGSNLVDELIYQGYEVAIVDDFSTGNKKNLNSQAKLFKGTITNLKWLQQVFNDFKPDFVFHTAALARVPRSVEDPTGTFKVNVDGTLNVFEAARNAKAKRVIYSSSSSVYGDQKKLPLIEDMEANPLNPYAMQKYIGELIAGNYAHVFGLDNVCLRYFNVYGPRQVMEGAYRLVIGIFIDQKKRGEKLSIFGDGKQTRDFTHVSDVIQANILAMKYPQKLDGRPFNIGFGQEVSVNKIAKLIGGEVTHLPPRPFEEKRKEADNSAAQKILKWKPKIDIETGIKQLL